MYIGLHVKYLFFSFDLN